MNHRRTALQVSLLAGDASVLVLALWAAAHLRFGQGWVGSSTGALPSNRGVALYVALALGVYALMGLYRLRPRWSAAAEVSGVVKANAVLLVVTMSLLYFFRMEDVSRLVLAYSTGLVTVGVAATRILVRGAFRVRRSRGRGLRHMLVVGEGIRVTDFLERALHHPEYGVRIVGQLSTAPEAMNDLRWLGTIRDLPEVLAREVVDEVAVCLPLSEWETVDTVVAVSELQGKSVLIPIPPVQRTIARGVVEDVAGLPVLALHSTSQHTVSLAAKRLLDIVGALALIIATSPIMVAAAIAIWVTDGRPILFKQDRGGLHGRTFGALKFRTMVRDAEARKAALMARNERSGVAFKLTDDPRVTKVGRLLRRTSMDELPQLFNVLKGEMSLVGPRPLPVQECLSYDLWHRRRQSVRPGMTGLWQVSARTDPDFDEWVNLDLQYIDSWSLLSDVRLLLQTPIALVRQAGK
jgi:exopolysaccharide biosynthesis polyprenyl glycosylphosphotransferase